jgi:gas vesicle protein
LDKQYLIIGVISALIGGLIGASIVTLMINPRLDSKDETIDAINNISIQIQSFEEKQNSFKNELYDFQTEVYNNIDDILLEIEDTENRSFGFLDEVSNRVEYIETQLQEEPEKEFHIIQTFTNINEFEYQYSIMYDRYWKSPFFEVNGTNLKIAYNIGVLNKYTRSQLTGVYLRICDEEGNIVDEWRFGEGKERYETFIGTTTSSIEAGRYCLEIDPDSKNIIQDLDMVIWDYY